MISLLAPMYNIVRNCRILFCCSFMSIFLTHPIYAVSNIQTTEIDSLLGVLKKTLPNNAEISVAIVKDGKVNFWGFRREKKNWLSVDNHESVFEIGSITKVFTSTLLSHALHQGVVGLDTPIKSVSTVPINGAEKNGQPITMVSLANHTSGLPRLPSNLVRSIIGSELLSAYLWPFHKKMGIPITAITKGNSISTSARV